MIQGDKFKNFGQLLFSVTVVMAIFSCQSVGKSIAYNVYDKAGLSYMYPLQFICNYIVGPVALLFVDYIMKRLKISLLLYIGSFQAAQYLFGSLLVSYCVEYDKSAFFCPTTQLTIIIAIFTLIGGVCGCIFFIAYPVYMNSVSNYYNKTLYFGIGYSAYLSSQLIGNLIGYLFFNKISQFFFYLITLICLVTIQPLLFFVKEQRKPDDMVKKPLKDHIILLRKTLENTNFILYIPYLTSTCMVAGAYFNMSPTLLRIVLGQTETDKTSILYMISGAGCVFGGIIVGKIAQLTSIFHSQWILSMIGVLYFITCTIAYNYMSIEMCFVSGFVIGMYMSGNDTVVASVVSKLINPNTEYFIADDMCTCMGYAVGAIIYLVIDQHEFHYYLIMLAAQLFLMMALAFNAQKRYDFGLKPIINESQDLNEEQK